MRINLSPVYCCLAVAALALSSAAWAGIYDELGPKEKNAVQKGGQAYRTLEVDGSAWPKIWVYQRIDATPEEVTAVFTDYRLHKEMFPRILKSEVSNRIDARTVDVDYTMSLRGIPGFSLPDENYTSRDTILPFDGTTYQVMWTKVRADHIPHVEGRMRVEALGNGSIIEYYNFIIPHEPTLASFIAKMAVKQARESVSSLGNHVVAERTENPALLQQQVQTLRTALSQ